MAKLSTRLTASRECDAEIAVAARQLLSMAADWALKFPKWKAATVPKGRVNTIGNVNGNGDYISGHFTSKPYTTSLDAAASLYATLPAMIPSDPLECCRDALKQRGL